MPNKKKIYVEFTMTPDELPMAVCQTLYFHEAEEFTAEIDWKRNKMLIGVIMLEEPSSDYGGSYDDFDKRVTFIDDEVEED